MINQRWNSDTGETIKFAIGGELIDGQNRLLAVIESGVTVDFDVVWDVPRDAMVVLDTGASRTGTDVLKIAGASSRSRSSAIVRWSILWDAKIYLGRGGTLSPTTTEILQRYLNEQGRYDSCATRAADCQNRGLGTGSAVGMAHYLFMCINVKQTHGFYDQYISGAGLNNGSPVLALRNRIARVRLDRITPAEQLALFIRAWNAYREDKTLERMMIGKGELSNSNFPQPK